MNLIRRAVWVIRVFDYPFERAPARLQFARLVQGSYEYQTERNLGQHRGRTEREHTPEYFPRDRT
jgi:hypothetical protein